MKDSRTDGQQRAKRLRDWLARRRQRGSLSELAIAVPALLLLGLSTLQGSLIYHGKSTLNYATFEAARTGATHNARDESMRRELGLRLAPLVGGDGGAEKAAQAIAASGLKVQDPLQTRIEVINPTPEAFRDWGVDDVKSGKRVIPNSHLRHQPNTAGTASGLTIRDANLLKIKVKYGFELKVPVVGALLAQSMSWFDAENARFYARNQIPLTSVATVRMQSAAWEEEILASASRAADARQADAEASESVSGDASMGFLTNPDAQQEDESDTGNGEQQDNDADNDGEEESAGEDAETGTSEEPTEGAIECEEVDTETDEPPEEEQGFWSSLKDRLGGALAEGYKFVRGFWEGIKNQIGDIYDTVTNPKETLEGLYSLAKSFVEDPEGTIRAIADVIGQDISALVNCGSFDRGRIIGENINPVFMLKLAVKLSRFDGDLVKAVEKTKEELGCASFVADTAVWTEKGLVPIQEVDVGDLVYSRNDAEYADEPQAVQETFTREAPSYRILITGQEQYHLTDEHPVWKQGRGWVEAKDVERGDVLATAAGDVVVIGNHAVDLPVKVYNFSVASTPSYFVGAAGLWVHNAECDLPWTQHLEDFPDVTLRAIDEDELFSGVASGSRNELRINLEKEYPDLKAKDEKDNVPDWEAHHVIPWNFHDNELLKRLEFDLNSIDNGIPLPKCRDNKCSTTHRGSHPGYNAAIAKQLEAIDNLEMVFDKKKEKWRVATDKDKADDKRPATDDEKKRYIKRTIEVAREALAKNEIALNKQDKTHLEEKWTSEFEKVFE